MRMLDTNICIYIIKKHPEKVLKHFESFQLGDICLSIISFSELLYGVEKSLYPEKNQKALEEFILPIEILPFDAEAAYHYARLRANLEKKGTIIGSMDLMIAAHALSTDTTLITNHIKEFQRVPNLKLEDWVH